NTAKAQRFMNAHFRDVSPAQRGRAALTRVRPATFCTGIVTSPTCLGSRVNQTGDDNMRLALTYCRRFPAVVLLEGLHGRAPGVDRCSSRRGEFVALVGYCIRDDHVKIETWRVPFFPASYHEIDGVANTSRHFETFARRHGLP